MRDAQRGPRRFLRIVKAVAFGVPAAVVIALLVAVFYLRSIAAERTMPFPAGAFVTRDTALVLVVRPRLEDDGLREFFDRAAEAFDAAAKARQSTFEKLAWFLLGFERPSELLTRPLPAEIAVLAEYDPRRAVFHTYAVYSVSGLARLARWAGEHLSLVSRSEAKRYEATTYAGETILVPRARPGPPAPQLSALDLEALVPPDPASGVCWSVVGNNVVVSRRPASLRRGVDRVKELSVLRAGGTAGRRSASVPRPFEKEMKEADAWGIAWNEHNEVLCVLALVARCTENRDLARWLNSDRAFRKAAAVRQLLVSADVQRGDRIVITVRLVHTRYDAAAEVGAVLVAALRAYRPPEPIRMRMEMLPLPPNPLRLRVTLSGVGKYLTNRRLRPKRSAR